MKKLRLISIIAMSIIMVGCMQSTDRKKKIVENKEIKKKVKTVVHQGGGGAEGPVLGIDVSHFQGNVDWVDIKKDGVYYSYAKATQGIAYKDPKFERNREDARRNGVLTGAYHFYIANEDAAKQAENFVATVKKLEKGDLIPVLDLEQQAEGVKIDKARFQENVKTWLRIVEEKLGAKPIIYTNRPFGNEYLTDKVFSEYNLWIAEYGVKKPRIPDTWKEKGWIMWQRTASIGEKGIKGDVDHDVFNGDFAKFKEDVCFSASN